MATVTDGGYPTLVNITKRLTPDGSVERQLADTLTKEQPLLEDIPWKEGNLETGHRITSVSGLPSPTWTKFNLGVDPTKGETIQYDETCGMLEAFSNIDTKLAELNGNEAAFRASEDDLFLEGYGQEVARSLFYESASVNPERIHGLTARYPATSGYTASSYVKTSGTVSSTNNRSIWIITWDENKLFGIYPKKSKAGLSHEDLGKRLVTSPVNGKQMLAYVTHFMWRLGFAVRDYRYAVRLQYNVADTTNNSTSGTALMTDLEMALSTVWKVTGRTRIYMDRYTRGLLGAQLQHANTNYLQYMKEGGTLQEAFLGVPIRITDNLVAESAIS